MFSRSLLFLSLLLACLSALSVCASASNAVVSNNAQSLVQTDIRRIIDIRTHIEEVMLTIKLKNVGKTDVSHYIVTVHKAKHAHLSLCEGELKKKKIIGHSVDIEPKPANHSQMSFHALDLPEPITPGSTATLIVHLVYTRTLTPFPTHIEQSDNQFVKYEDNIYYFSLYPTTKQVTNVKLSSSRIESYTKKSAKKSGEDLEYGEYNDVDALAYSPLNIHYMNNSPFVTFNYLQKDIEVSHWGNVAIQDNYYLTHTGAVFHGPFSRFDYERQQWGGAPAPATFRTLVAHLPKHAQDIYYRDIIGNVSTSKVRKQRDMTHMEVDPRFPMFGGWSADFNIGYNLPSQHYLHVDNNDASHYVLNISFGAPFPVAAIDDLTVRVILPEGAANIEWQTPFDIDSAHLDSYKTYLDTTGRPTLILKKANCVKHHGVNFQVSYTFAQVSILREPLLITAALFTFFAIAIFFYRAELSISDDEEEVQEKKEQDTKKTQ